MAFERELDPDWFHEVPFYLAATVAYGFLFLLNPSLRWGSAERPPDPSVPIEFVAAPPPTPAPTPNLAPAGGRGKTAALPHKGPGKFTPEKVRRGAVDPTRKAKPTPKPAAVKSHREKTGNTLRKAKPAGHARARPTVDPKVAAAAAAEKIRRVEAERVAAHERAVEMRRKEAEAWEEKQRHDAEVKAAKEAKAEAARVERAQKAEAARVERLRREEIARVERERAAEAAALEKARREEAARLEAERKAAEEQARRERIAAERAAKAAKKAQLTQELATMDDPDNALAQDAGAAPRARGGKAGGTSATHAGGASATVGGKASGRGATVGGGLAGGGSAGAGAAADLAESADPGDGAGSGGSDVIDAPATGGGVGPDGSGVSYSVDGPVGNRRLLHRAVPVSPDWVGARGLELTVTVRFQVLPNGKVKAGAVIQKTSGFPEIDQRALEALRRWKFQAIPSNTGPEVWGRVSFRFTS
jgi:TonB family protein